MRHHWSTRLVSGLLALWFSVSTGEHALAHGCLSAAGVGIHAQHAPLTMPHVGHTGHGAHAHRMTHAAHGDAGVPNAPPVPEDAHHHPCIGCCIGACATAALPDPVIVAWQALATPGGAPTSGERARPVTAFEHTQPLGTGPPLA